MDPPELLDGIHHRDQEGPWRPAQPGHGEGLRRQVWAYINIFDFYPHNISASSVRYLEGEETALHAWTTEGYFSCMGLRIELSSR